jgi:CheY-like chemotaxis protein
MPTVLCLDDFTSGLSDAVEVLRENGYRVLAADDSAVALELAADTPLDAVLVNCHRDKDNSGLVAALRNLQPGVAVVMFSGYCGVPCHQLQLADACFQKGETPTTLLPILRAVLCQNRYGRCRSVQREPTDPSLNPSEERRRLDCIELSLPKTPFSLSQLKLGLPSL